MQEAVSRLIHTSVDDCKSALKFFTSKDLPMLREALKEAEASKQKTKAKALESRIKQLMVQPHDRRSSDHRCLCRNLASCVCDVIKQHKRTCRYRIAACLSFELACDHGLQGCPQCDPCTCGSTAHLEALR
jgi:hypothetical protein